MPCGRKSGGAQKGGGFGKSLTTRSRQHHTAGGLDYQKPDISRLRNEKEVIKATTVMDFVSSEKKAVSILEAKDLDDFFTQTLMQKRTYEENRALVIVGRDGSQVSTNAELIAVPTKRDLTARPEYRRFELPKRPFAFYEPQVRVLHFAQYLGELSLALKLKAQTPEVDESVQDSESKIEKAESDIEEETSQEESHSENGNVSDEESVDGDEENGSEDKEDEKNAAPTRPERIHDFNFKQIPDGVRVDASPEELIAEAMSVTDVDLFLSALTQHYSKQENFAPLLTKDQLEEEEISAFSRWRNELAQVEKEGLGEIVITPYEKNLAYWKQLWRTVERSDLILEIVDARNPLLFRSESLESLVTDSDKKVLLVMNKTDYLSPLQRSIWRKFFEEKGLEVVFYSALKELSALELSEASIPEESTLKLTKEALKQAQEFEAVVVPASAPAKKPVQRRPKKGGFADLVSDRSDEGESDEEAEDSSTVSDEEEIADMSQMQDDRRDRRGRIGNDENEIKSRRASVDMNAVGYLSIKAETNWEGVATGQELQRMLEDRGVQLLEKRMAATEQALRLYDHFETLLQNVGNNVRLSAYQDLIANVFWTLRPDRGYDTRTAPTRVPQSYLSLYLGPREPLTRPSVSLMETDTGSLDVLENADEVAVLRPVIGTVGFPNVGKSSLINSLMKGLKRVAVSRTPGKTKHLQTLNIPESMLTLCDCPGLVMPTSACSKEDLVINNIMNSDTYRGSLVAPMANLLRRVSLQIADIYGVKEEFDQFPEARGCQVWDKPRDSVSIVATARRYFAGGKGGLADVERMCRLLIKVYTEGKFISYCEPCPDSTDQEWLKEEDMKWQERRLVWRASRSW